MLSAVLLGKDVHLLDLVAFGASYGASGNAGDGRLFEGFADKGWMFSKVLAIGITGFLTWFLVAVEILPFTTLTCVASAFFVP